MNKFKIGDLVKIKRISCLSCPNSSSEGICSFSDNKGEIIKVIKDSRGNVRYRIKFLSKVTAYKSCAFYENELTVITKKIKNYPIVDWCKQYYK